MRFQMVQFKEERKSQFSLLCGPLTHPLLEQSQCRPVTKESHFISKSNSSLGLSRKSGPLCPSNDRSHHTYILQAVPLKPLSFDLK